MTSNTGSPDYSHAPPATPRRDATVKIVVMGDANADWLAYGLEDAFSEKPEIGIVRGHPMSPSLIEPENGARGHSKKFGAARAYTAAASPRTRG